MVFTAEHKFKEIVRELGMRSRVYARMVAEGKMTQSAADLKIAILKEIAEDYKEQMGSERLL